MKELNLIETEGETINLLLRESKNKWIFKGIWVTKEILKYPLKKGRIVAHPDDEFIFVRLTEEELKEQNMVLNVPYSTLDLEGLKSFIYTFELIRKEKIDVRGTNRNTILIEDNPVGEYSKYIKWKTNDAKIRILTCYFSEDKEYSIAIRVKNKYRVNYQGDEFREKYAMDDTGEYDISRYLNSENYGGTGIDITEEGLTQFIEDLISEYEEVSGEEYDRLEPKKKYEKYFKNSKKSFIKKIFG